MKRTVTVMLMACVFCLNICGQSKSRTLSIIPKVGTNISNVTSNELFVQGDMALKSKSKAGLVFGLDAQYQISDQCAVSLGVGYSRQGYRYGDCEYKVSGTEDYDVYEGMSDNHHNIDYLTVPLMVRGYVARGLSVGVGVQCGFILDNKMKYETSAFNVYRDGSREYTTRSGVKEVEWGKSMLNSFDVSIPLSVAYEYSNVIVSASYNIGLRNVCKQTDGKNKVIMFTAGYKFDLCRL